VGLRERVRGGSMTAQRHARRSFTVSQRAHILSKTEGRCVYCRCQLPKTWHVEHLDPLCLGGTNEDSNLRAACVDCNQRKGGMDFKVWILQLLTHWQKRAKSDELQDLRHQVQTLQRASGFEQELVELQEESKRQRYEFARHRLELREESERQLLEVREESERLRHELARLQSGYDAVTRIRRERDRLRARVKTLHSEWRPSAVMVISGPTSRRAA
jgi:DNA repair exonuclease SbcCD ATPase subunit